MNEIALHRGNTYNAIENSIESIFFDAVSKSLINGLGSMVDQGIVYEVDIIAVKPFVVFHSPEDLAQDVFDSDIDITGKKVWNLDRTEIENCRYRGTESMPMVLTELLEIAKTRGAKLYLDIKVPKIMDSLSMSNSIRELCDIVKVYANHGIIDSIFCFNSFTILSINRYLLENGMKGMISIGMFCSQYLSSEPLNFYYHKLLYQLLEPNLISYQKEIVRDESYKHYMKYFYDEGKDKQTRRSYIWTIHRNDLPDYQDLLERYGLIPVIDMFNR